jgi:predicted MFS family arabinose efflux permease
MLGIFLLMMLEHSGQTWLLHAFPPVIAIGFSSRQSLYPTMAADLFHGRAFGAIIGAISLFIGIGAGLGPWLGGALFDWTGSYQKSFWAAEATALASVVFIWLAGRRREQTGRGS